MNSRISISRSGDVHFGIRAGSTPSGGTTYAWSFIGRVEKRDRKWLAFDHRRRHISTARTRREAASDVRFAWTDRAA